VIISVAPKIARLGYWRNATLSSVRYPYRLSGMMMMAALSGTGSRHRWAECDGTHAELLERRSQSLNTLPNR
jgi:hypothetical protein